MLFLIRIIVFINSHNIVVVESMVEWNEKILNKRDSHKKLDETIMHDLEKVEQ